MKRAISKAFTLAALVLGTGAAQAQNVDIGLFQNGNELEVRVRPTEDFTGILSSVVFTIRWDRTTGAKLMEHTQKSAAATYIPISRSGEAHEVGSLNYQIYAGFGFDAISEQGGWKAGQEYTIASIPCSGKGTYSLVNDAWTGVDENNGDYYISLNGYDRTGTIYKDLSNAGTEQEVVSISPNPSRGIMTITIPLNAGEETKLEIVNAAGQVVFKDTPRQMEGSYRHDVDISSYGSGNYMLRITRNGAVENHKIMVQ